MGHILTPGKLEQDPKKKEAVATFQYQSMQQESEDSWAWLDIIESSFGTSQELRNLLWI